MKKIDRIIQNYDEMSNMFLLDFILFSENINEVLSQTSLVIMTSEFLKFLKSRLMIIRDVYNYPQTQIKKVKILLDYIKQNSHNLNQELDECYYILENITTFSNDKYLDEFHMKKNILNDFRQNECYIWNKKDMDESICFDYITYISFSVDDDNKYNLFYMPKFVLSRNYIYAIKKIIYLCPEVFKIEQFRERVQEIIKINLEQLQEYDEDTIKEYIKQNYHTDKVLKFSTEQLEEFKREVEHTSYQLEHINIDPFDLSEFKLLHQLLMLEQNIYFDDKLDISNIDLDAIFHFINKNIENSMLNKKQKEKLLGILIRKRYDFSSLEEWKQCCSKLDKIQEIDDDNLVSRLFDSRTDRMDLIRCMYMLYIKGDPSLLFNVVNSRQYDLGNFESFIVGDKDFGYIEDYLMETNYPVSILRFIEEAPSIFMDQTVYNRTMKILSNYDDKYSKKAIKKLEKIMKR